MVQLEGKIRGCEALAYVGAEYECYIDPVLIHGDADVFAILHT